MGLISRRKPAYQHPANSCSLLELPDDILILVCSQCRIDDLLAARLVHSRLRDLIKDYIGTIAPAVARSTFPHSDHLLERHGQNFTLQRLKGLRIEQLAAILMDRHRFVDSTMQGRYGIPAEDAFGDKSRDRLVLAWRVFLDFSTIAQEVYRCQAKASRNSAADFVASVIQPSRFKLDMLMQSEDLILQRRMDYVTKMPRAHVLEYKNLVSMLSSGINAGISNQGEGHRRWPFSSDAGLDARRAFRKGETWLTWYLLGQGPEIFWQQWWNLAHDEPRSRNFIRDQSIEAFKSTPRPLAEHQQRLANRLQMHVYERLMVDGPQEDDDATFRDWSVYALIRQSRAEAGQAAAREILDHVPFQIHFQCPEDLVRKMEAIKGGLQGSHGPQLVPR